MTLKVYEYDYRAGYSTRGCIFIVAKSEESAHKMATEKLSEFDHFTLTLDKVHELTDQEYVLANLEFDY